MIRCTMILFLLLPLSFLLNLVCSNPKIIEHQNESAMDSIIHRAMLFGRRLPQEKVFVHMDNTCYFLGDTIWFAAYTRRSSDDHPSRISRVLYAELWNHDGYLVERKLVEMKEGKGHGFFSLPDTLYSGFYELRAYTRWQLNWGITEHPHTWSAELWFHSKEMAKNYYRDYDKLYSRVFPVYDRPKQKGEFFHDMTLRPLRRYFKDEAGKPALRLSLFPEGGSFVSGIPCCVAFEAATEEGEWVEGKLRINDTEIPTENRGRGTFVITPERGKKYEATFTAGDGRNVKATLPPVEEDGVVLTVKRDDDGFLITVRAQGQAENHPLGLSLMHEGVMEACWQLTSTFQASLSCDSLSAGVHQLTVFDAEGRVWADRLFFVTDTLLAKSPIYVKGLKPQYEPFEKIDLLLERRDPSNANNFLSVSVRDAIHQDRTYDSGNIMTEMLLSSEIKGFVPQPDYFFETDDTTHRRALDLLMLTQGWRRFNWREMAVSGAFELTQPAEYSQVLTGIVKPYSPLEKEDELRAGDMAVNLYHIIVERPYYDTSLPSIIDNPYEYSLIQRDFRESVVDQMAVTYGSAKQEWHENLLVMDTKDSQIKEQTITAKQQKSFDDEVNRNKQKTTTRKHNKAFSATDATERVGSNSQIMDNIRLHAEFTQEGSDALEGDMNTKNGRFRVDAPNFYGQCYFFLAASDTTKWKHGRAPVWIHTEEEDYPEYSVHLFKHFPRFVKPYSYYQTHLKADSDGVFSSFSGEEGDKWMKPISVRTKHNGLRAFDPSKPAIVLDAYQAYNEVVDAGLSDAWFAGQSTFIPQIARNYIGDMNMERPYEVENRYEGKNLSANLSYEKIKTYNYLYNLDKVYIYTDYSPRQEGSKRFEGANQPTVTIDLHSFPDKSRRLTYRDRRYILDGFSFCEDFYHPDYQRHLPMEGQKDYRRTLYWNPELQLDNEGKAQLTFYNNSRQTSLCVDVQGQAQDGTLLYNK